MAIETVEPQNLTDLVEPTEAVRVEPAWYRYEDIAAALRVAIVTVHGWRRRGMIPSPVRMGKYSRYPRDVFDRITTYGPDPVGTHAPTDGPMTINARKGGGDWRKPKGMRTKAQQLAQVAKKKKKPAAKKPATKKPAAKKKKGRSGRSG